MHVLRRLFDAYGEGMLAFPGLTGKLSTLLRDPQDSIRQLAVEIMGLLYTLRGESLMVRQCDAQLPPMTVIHLSYCHD